MPVPVYHDRSSTRSTCFRIWSSGTKSRNGPATNKSSCHRSLLPTTDASSIAVVVKDHFSGPSVKDFFRDFFNSPPVPVYPRPPISNLSPFIAIKYYGSFKSNQREEKACQSKGTHNKNIANLSGLNKTLSQFMLRLKLTIAAISGATRKKRNRGLRAATLFDDGEDSVSQACRDFWRGSPNS